MDPTCDILRSRDSHGWTVSSTLSPPAFAHEDGCSADAERRLRRSPLADQRTSCALPRTHARRAGYRTSNKGAAASVLRAPAPVRPGGTTRWRLEPTDGCDQSTGARPSHLSGAEGARRASVSHSSPFGAGPDPPALKPGSSPLLATFPEFHGRARARAGFVLVLLVRRHQRLDVGFLRSSAGRRFAPCDRQEKHLLKHPGHLRMDTGGIWCRHSQAARWWPRR